jgi:VWFA-related protein
MPTLARLAVAAALFAAPALAQLQETVNVHLVEVPVTVVGRDGEPVRGLTAANFEIIDGGRKRPLASFDAVDFAAAEGAKAVSPLNPVARRNFLLLFDLSFSAPTSIAKAQQAARDFLVRGAGQRDLVAVGSVDADRGFRLLTSFTTDRNLLNAAITDPRSFRANDPLQIGGTPAIDLTTASRPGDTASAHDEAAATFNEMMLQQSRLDDEFMRARIVRQMDALGELARTLRSIAGRKQIIMFSEGFDPRLARGRDASAGDEQQKELDQIVAGTPWRTDPDARFGTIATLDAIKRMGKEFRAADVVLHSIDIKGVRVNNDVRRGAQLSSNEALFLVANPTGGEVFHNSNDLGDDLRRMLRAQEVVYVLSFNARSSAPGTFHDLRVRLVDGPRGARVFHRAGYYELGSENAAERSLTNAEIVLNDIPQSEVHIDALAAAFPTSGARSQVPVVLEINGADLLQQLPANSPTATADIYIYAFDDDGLVRDRLYQRLTLDVQRAGGRIQASGVKYYGTLSLPEGRYAVKTLVRMVDDDRRGFARVDVLVPREGDVAVLPPLFFDDPAQWLVVRGASNDRTNAGYPFMLNGEPFMPSATARVRNGQPRKYALFVMNAEPDEMSFETSAGAAPVTPRLVSRVRARDVDMTKVVFELAPHDLAPGNSTLHVIVRRKDSSDARSSSVSLVVN